MILTCQRRKSALTWTQSSQRALHGTPVSSVAVLAHRAMCQLHPRAGGPARTWNFLPGLTGGGAFYGMAFNESLYPSFIYIAVYTVHYFPHKSTSVNHFVICLFLEMKCDYIKQCSHKKSSYSSNNCLKTYILTAFPR